MDTGIVKWFNDAKGFGFITSDNGGEDLFAHFSEIRMEGFKTLKENQRVSFEVKTGPKGKPRIFRRFERLKRTKGRANPRLGGGFGFSDG